MKRPKKANRTSHRRSAAESMNVADRSTLGTNRFYFVDKIHTRKCFVQYLHTKIVIFIRRFCFLFISKLNMESAHSPMADRWLSNHYPVALFNIYTRGSCLDRESTNLRCKKNQNIHTTFRAVNICIFITDSVAAKTSFNEKSCEVVVWKT